MKFDANKITNEIVNFVREYYRNNNIKGAVIGISGGKDSGVVAGLMCKAIGAENVAGLKLPCHSIVEDSSLADKLAQHYGFKLYNCDLTTTFDEFENAVQTGFGKVDKDRLKNSSINLKPRLRMSALYYYAAMLSELNGGTYLVVGTSNKSELFVGYFTKGGDNVNDIALLYDLTVEEVIKVGEVVGVPSEILYRVPSDGLSGTSDEEKLGVKYSDIAKFMEDKNSVENDIAEKINRLHKSTRHKFINNYDKKED